MIKISIIMPVYNGEKYIRQSIDSILAQSFQDWELIIFDDKSNDTTREIIEEYQYKYSNIHILFSEKKQFISWWRNIWIQQAKWKYICLIDHDDVWISKDKLLLQHEYMEKNEDIGICWASYIIIDEKNNEIWRRQVWNTDLNIKDNLLVFSPFLPSTVIIKKYLFYKYGFFDQNYEKVEDYELWLRFSSHTHVHNLKEYLVQYRIHTTNSSVQFRNVIIMKSLELKLIWKYRNTYNLNLKKALLKLSMLVVSYKFLSKNPRLTALIKNIFLKN